MKCYSSLFIVSSIKILKQKYFLHSYNFLNNKEKQIKKILTKKNLNKSNNIGCDS